MNNIKQFIHEKELYKLKTPLILLIVISIIFIILFVNKNTLFKDIKPLTNNTYGMPISLTIKNYSDDDWEVRVSLELEKAENIQVYNNTAFRYDSYKQEKIGDKYYGGSDTLFFIDEVYENVERPLPYKVENNIYVSDTFILEPASKWASLEDNCGLVIVGDDKKELKQIQGKITVEYREVGTEEWKIYKTIKQLESKIEVIPEVIIILKTPDPETGYIVLEEWNVYLNLKGYLSRYDVSLTEPRGLEGLKID